MTLSEQQAAEVAALWAQISAVEQMISNCQTALDEQWGISSVTLRRTSDGSDIPLVTAYGQVPDDIAGAMFEAALSRLQTILDGLRSGLTAY